MSRLDAFRAMTAAEVIECLAEDSSVLGAWQDEIGQMQDRAWQSSAQLSNALESANVRSAALEKAEAELIELRAEARFRDEDAVDRQTEAARLYARILELEAEVARLTREPARAAALVEASKLLHEWAASDFASGDRTIGDAIWTAAICVHELINPAATRPCICEGCPDDVPRFWRSGACRTCANEDCEHDETCKACADATGGVCKRHQEAECTCYELTGGHQPGCAFNGTPPGGRPLR